MKNIPMYLLFIAFFFLLAGCGIQNDGSTSQSPPAFNPDASLIFFYSDTCPHCKNVEDYFAQNKTAEKIEFESVEVSSSPDANALFFAKASACGISEAEMGVPMLWNNGSCLSGDQDIIDYFNKQTDVQKQ